MLSPINELSRTKSFISLKFYVFASMKQSVDRLDTLYSICTVVGQWQKQRCAHQTH